MKVDNRHIRDYISVVSMFVKENDTIVEALILMQKLNTPNLIVVKENLAITGNISKEAIEKYLKANKLSPKAKQTKVSAIKDTEKAPVILYPGTSIYQANSIMKCLNVNKLPVADKPWNKKIIGSIFKKDILSTAL